jgi:lysylphosphatidylglycerol synthetase-like protein (DUF2156 family)
MNNMNVIGQASHRLLSKDKFANMPIFQKAPTEISIDWADYGSLGMLARYANHTSAYLAMNQETRHFTSQGVEGFIAYRSTPRVLFQFGGVFAPPVNREVLLRDFLAMAKRVGKHVCVVQIIAEDIDLYRSAGFCINQLGSSYTLDLKRFKIAGTRFMKMRNKIARASKAGVKVVELGVDAPRTDEAWVALKLVSNAWLHSKGRYTKMIEFMVGELGIPADLNRRVFVAQRDNQIIAFITYVPTYGTYAGVLHDLSRRLPDASPGVMELINFTAIQRFQAEGIEYLNLGFTPFTNLSEGSDNVEGRSRTVAYLVRMLARYGQTIYPAEAQVQYKLKWNPHIIMPEYVAFHDRFRWSSLWHLLLLTRVI